MQRYLLIIGIIVMFIGMSILPSTALNLEEKYSLLTYYDNKTVYVGGNRPGNYTSIQDGIDNASNGDTIFVFDDSSPYYENVVVDKSINLIGEDKDTTIIDGSGTGDVVYVTADWVNISGFTIRNGNYHNGIDIRSNYSTITGNVIWNNFDGILLPYFSNNTIAGNNISSNKCNGINLYESSNNTINGNTIRWNGWDGINMYFSSSNNILNNIILKNGDGMDLCASSNNNISGNIISSNDYGIILFPYSLLSPPHCTYNIISGNTIVLNIEDGIFLWDSYRNTIIGNEITYNYENGIYLRNSSTNTIISNNITNNDEGIYLHQGSCNNNIYHNNFIKNFQNTYDNGTNIWDDSKYGNYWSNYKQKYPDAKPKLLKPWMWDTSYEIPGGDNKDRCPLIKQWPNPASKTMPKNKMFYNPLLLRLLERLFERFPILEQILASRPVINKILNIE